MKHILSFLAMLCLFFKVGAQENNIKKETVKADAQGRYTALKPGDRVPDILLGRILNPGKDKAQRTADFKGKLLIIDFWATSCGACIEAMPRLDSMASLFGNKIVILPVTNENLAHIISFQQYNKFLNGERFRTVVEDKILGELFPHRLLPHDVWIDSNGVVLGYTAVEAITAETIRRVLDGKGLQAPEKKDVMDYDRLKPLLVSNNGGNDTAYQYRSILTGHLPGVQSAVSIRYDSLHNRTIVKATNVRIRQLYTILYKGIRNLPENQIDTGPDQNVYCYELDFPGKARGPVRKKMEDDLIAYFRVKPEWTGTAFRLLPMKEQDNNDEPLSL